MLPSPWPPASTGTHACLMASLHRLASDVPPRLVASGCRRRPIPPHGLPLPLSHLLHCVPQASPSVTTAPPAVLLLLPFITGVPPSLHLLH
ncbi:hypothetical protein GUJ93_ZPchr0012g22165 [Zizania palustris]|uniref:Uncharacterized protein n=1 Tax=Zizania palustris TaxID=103762 RepID=A0A8J6BPP8_ZIZPA|nr:hypothetical protein GUJ93_ZPchr0012g22165 [Zizania palustris]